MWSGPRNISTAMMRAFENRPDAAVSDEPFYAAYLKDTGLIHPMREAILAAQPQDWRTVATAMVGPVPGGRAIWYQKHMTHHMRPSFGRDWIDRLCNVFLIRPPEAVIASYVEKRAEVTLEEIGFPQQVELFERIAERSGRAPPVLEAGDVLADPTGALTRLCRACDIPFHPGMVSWRAGRRDTDGVWAPAWYDAVERSVGFAGPRPTTAIEDLPHDLRLIAQAGRPLYDRLARYRI